MLIRIWFFTFILFSTTSWSATPDAAIPLDCRSALIRAVGSASLAIQCDKSPLFLPLLRNHVESIVKNSSLASHEIDALVSAVNQMARFALEIQGDDATSERRQRQAFGSLQTFLTTEIVPLVKKHDSTDIAEAVTNWQHQLSQEQAKLAEVEKRFQEAKIIDETGYFIDAIEAYQEVREMMVSKFGYEDPDYAEAFAYLAVTTTYKRYDIQGQQAFALVRDYYRVLSASGIPAYQARLARSLVKCARYHSLPEPQHVVMSFTGVIHEDHQERYKILSEAIDILRHLTNSNPKQFRPDLAWGLCHAGSESYVAFPQLEAQGRMMEECFAIYRELVRDDPQTYRPVLAAALRDHGRWYRPYVSSKRDTPFQLKCLEEALALYRKLAQQAPVRYTPELADTLFLIALKGGVYNGHRGQEPAFNILEPLLEARVLYRELALVSPLKYLGDLAAIERDLYRSYRDSGQHEEAFEAIAAAVEHTRPLFGRKGGLDIWGTKMFERLDNAADSADQLGKTELSNEYLSQRNALYFQLRFH